MMDEMHHNTLPPEKGKEKKKLQKGNPPAQTEKEKEKER